MVMVINGTLSEREKKEKKIAEAEEQLQGQNHVVSDARQPSSTAELIFQQRGYQGLVIF